MKLIQINNLWKRYGDQVVLENLNATIDEGEFITIVGASGCGKSTLLNLLLGTDKPSKGELLLDDRSIPDEPTATRGIVFQRYSVFAHLTVLRNVLIAREFTDSPLLARLRGANKTEALAHARQMLSDVGLAESENKYPHQLSGGMQQRLALAQALIARPRVLLLDEPFGALDPGIRKDMHDLVLSLWKRHQLTIFMVTHDLREGFTLGTRLWVFDKTRTDPQHPDAYGAQITFDIPAGQRKKSAPETPENLLQETIHE